MIQNSKVRIWSSVYVCVCGGESSSINNNSNNMQLQQQQQQQQQHHLLKFGMTKKRIIR